MIVSLTLFALAVALYALHELSVHGKIRFKGDFWGEYSYLRKYKQKITPLQQVDYLLAPKNWYYKLIGVKYKERWPTSTWLTVMFTDAPHMLQFFYCILFCISAVSYETIVNRWVDGGIYWGVWHLVFPITYKIFSK